jgi:hypothetical protein
MKKMTSLTTIIMSLALFLTSGCAEKICENAKLTDFWDDISNPVYSHEGWSTKDACMIEKDGRFHLFFSAFYHDRGRERSHVTSVITSDFKTFSDPLFMWDGREDDWIGMCSPNITGTGEKYYLTYNSWGDKKGKHNQLFYAVSEDLVNWKKDIPLAPNITKGKRAIDAAAAYNGKEFFLIFKQEKPGVTRLARAEEIDGQWEYVSDGLPQLLMADGKDNGMTHENYEFIKIDGKWMMVTTDYKPHQLHIYTMKGDGDSPEDWLMWVDGRGLLMPGEDFNTNHNSNAAFIADRRHIDGYFYCLYAGRTEGDSHARRGDNKLALARSKDLVNWQVP